MITFHLFKNFSKKMKYKTKINKKINNKTNKVNKIINKYKKIKNLKIIKKNKNKLF